MKIRNYSLEQIKALIVEGTDLLVVTSPANSDKNSASSLSMQVESIRAPNWRTSLILANANTDIDSLSYEIIEQASLDRSIDKLPAVSQVHKYLEYSALNGILPVIMIDAAHKLSTEVLEFVLQLGKLRYGESLFRIILFADETINEHLDVPGLKNLTTGLLHNIHTTSFTKEEAKENTDNDSSSYDEIDEYLIDDEVVLGNTEKETSMSRYGLFIIVIGLISVLLIYLYLNDQEHEDVIDSTVSMQSQITISEGLDSQVDEAVILEEDIERLEEENELIDEDNLSVDNQFSQIKPESSIEEDMAESISDIQVTEVDEVIEIPFVELPDYVEEIESSVVEDVEALILKTDDENVFNLETVPDYLSNIKGRVWLGQQPANSYVLQLMSARYISNLEKLLSGQSGMQDQLSGYVKYTPSGKPRYLLLYGIYPDVGAARSAIDELPMDLQSINPWPRSVADVIKELDTVLAPFIEIEEGIEIPLGEFHGEIEEIESPVNEEIKKELIPTIESENTFNLKTVPDFLSGIKGPQWLRQQSDNSYVLQLISAQFKSNLGNLLSGQSGIQNQLSGYVKYTPSGKSRYLLLYGIYPDKKTAEAAINELPAELQSVNPWPRSIEDVIKELDALLEPSIDEDMSESILGLG